MAEDHDAAVPATHKSQYPALHSEVAWHDTIVLSTLFMNTFTRQMAVNTDNM